MASEHPGDRTVSQADILPTENTDFELKSMLVVVFLPSCAFSMHTLLQLAVPAIAPCGTQAAGPQGNKKPQTVAVASCIYLFASTFLEGI